MNRWASQHPDEDYDAHVDAMLDEADRTRKDAEVKPPAPPLRRIEVNPEPLKVVSVPVCIYCHQRAPWCSCGRGPGGGYR